MASLESKLLDGKNAGYCSSSDEEDDGWQVAKDEDEHQSNVMRRLPFTSNTGAKGVLSEYAATQKKVAETRQAKEKELINVSRKGMLQSSKAEREQAQNSESDDEDSIESLRQRRLMELRKAAAGRVLEILEKEQFSKAIDTCETMLCVLIYEPDNEMCEKMTHICKVLAGEYSNVKFVRVRSTILEMSKAFTKQALPTMQFYLKGDLIGNFIKLPSLLGEDIDVESVKKFLKRQHLDLVYAKYTTDSESSEDDA